MQKTIKLSVIALTISVITACNNTQVDLSSQVQLPPQFDQVSAINHTYQQYIQQWWKNWHDTQLNQLIEQGLQSNLDLAIAEARLQEAQAISRAANADLGPSVGISGNAGAGINDLDTGIINPSSNRMHGLVGGITASWEPDIFGQKRSDLDAAEHAALSYQQQVYGSQLLITGQIAEAYFALLAIEQQQKVVQQQISTLQQLHHYLQARFQSGDINAYDKQEINKNISGLQAKQATLQAQRDAQQRTIAVLLGKTPQDFSIQTQPNSLHHIPTPPTGIQPSTILTQRPDIMANMERVYAYSAKLASAKADLLPRFDIRFVGQGGRIELDNDLSYLSGVGSFISLGVQLPLFTNGRIQANIDAADARLKTALIQYDQILLTALAEVDNAYQMQVGLNKQTELLQRSVQQAQNQAFTARKLYEYGDKTFDSTLTAQLDVLDYQLQLIQSQYAQATNLISLYKAIGGGWQQQ